jgi:hypothetical protein
MNLRCALVQLLLEAAAAVLPTEERNANSDDGKQGLWYSKESQLTSSLKLDNESYHDPEETHSLNLSLHVYQLPMEEPNHYG